MRVVKTSQLMIVYFLFFILALSTAEDPENIFLEKCIKVSGSDASYIKAEVIEIAIKSFSNNDNKLRVKTV